MRIEGRGRRSHHTLLERSIGPGETAWSDFLWRFWLQKPGSEYFREGNTDAVAEVCPYLLSKPFGSEYLLGNTVHAVASLLRGAACKAAASEYFREGNIDAVADVYPYLLSQPLGSEYLLGNTVHAVASLLHGAACKAAASEYFRGENTDAVAEVCPYLLSKPIGSEELYGNSVYAVASRLRGTACGAAAGEESGGKMGIAAAMWIRENVTETCYAKYGIISDYVNG